MRLTGAGIYCEGERVYSREINEIHRDWMKLLNSDVFCFGNIWRYIGDGLYWPIPMYFLLGIGPSYIGMGIEILIPMYRLLKLGSPYIGMALNRASPMYVPKTIHSGYIGMLQEHQIPMYPKKEYIGTPQKKQSRCIHPSKIPQVYRNLSILATRGPTYSYNKANLRANHSETHRNSSKTGNLDVSSLPNSSKLPKTIRSN